MHGNSLNSPIFKYLFNHLSKQYKVIAIDSRGHGLSELGNITCKTSP
ncbi:alpha/beta fold hydrolase [Metabacillus fastidiosus]